MCGDDDVVRNGRLVSHHRLAAFVAQRRKNEHRELGVPTMGLEQRQVSRRHGATGTLSWACTKTMCRPALALSRRQTRSE